MHRSWWLFQKLAENNQKSESPEVDDFSESYKLPKFRCRMDICRFTGVGDFFQKLAENHQKSESPEVGDFTESYKLPKFRCRMDICRAPKLGTFSKAS